MKITIKNNEPFAKLQLEGVNGEFFNQDFLIDTGFTEFCVFYSSNKKLLSSLRRASPFSFGKKVIVGDEREVAALLSSVRFLVNNEIDEVPILVLEATNKKALPVIGIEFLKTFQAFLQLDFKNREHVLDLTREDK